MDYVANRSFNYTGLAEFYPENFSPADVFEFMEHVALQLRNLYLSALTGMSFPLHDLSNIASLRYSEKRGFNEEVIDDLEECIHIRPKGWDSILTDAYGFSEMLCSYGVEKDILDFCDFDDDDCNYIHVLKSEKVGAFLSTHSKEECRPIVEALNSSYFGSVLCDSPFFYNYDDSKFKCFDIGYKQYSGNCVLIDGVFMYAAITDRFYLCSYALSYDINTYLILMFINDYIDNFGG